jgi:hypothetical protein
MNEGETSMRGFNLGFRPVLALLIAEFVIVGASPTARAQEAAPAAGPIAVNELAGVILKAGDAIFYEADVVHTARGAGDTEAVVLGSLVLKAGGSSPDASRHENGRPDALTETPAQGRGSFDYRSAIRAAKRAGQVTSPAPSDVEPACPPT